MKMDGRLLNKSVDDKLLKVYEMYLTRRIKEYDLVWSAFKTYLTINTFAAGIFGVLLQSFSKSDIAFLRTFIILWATLAILGCLLSVMWFRQCRDSHKWSLMLNSELAEIERAVFQSEKMGFYIKTAREYPANRRFGFDALDINTYTALLFVVWWFIVFCVICFKK